MIDGAKAVVEEVQNEISKLTADEQTEIKREDKEEDVTVRDTNVRIWQGKLEDALSDVESARDEEQEYYDNMPEPFQSSERGDNAQSAVDALERAADDLTELTQLEDPADFTAMFHEKVDNIISNLEEASGY